MSILTISLPEPYRQYVERLVAKGVFEDPSDYFLSLMNKDWLERDRERIEALFIEGLESGPSTPFTEQDWEDMRKRLESRVAARNRT